MAENDDFSEFMNVKNRHALPKDIAAEGKRLMFKQLQNHTDSEKEALQLVRLMKLEYPGKPTWWLLARALWEQEKGVC